VSRTTGRVSIYVALGSSYTGEAVVSLVIRSDSLTVAGGSSWESHGVRMLRNG
jgi:hypothetical protein